MHRHPPPFPFPILVLLGAVAVARCATSASSPETPSPTAIIPTATRPLTPSSLVAPIPITSSPISPTRAPHRAGRIAFVTQWQSSSSYNEDIYLVNSDGTGLVNITEANDSNQFDYLSWAPDGTRLAFLSNGPQGPGVYTLYSDGSGLTPIAEGTQPTWSPDGTMIALRRHTSREWWQWHLVVISIDGTGERIVASDLGDQGTPSWTSFSWSPDSHKIAFTMWAGSSAQVFVVDADGSGLHQLTSAEQYPQDYSWGPSWSPDGRLIAFSRPSGIYAVTPDGTQTTQLLRLQWGYLASPAWSPDGTRIIAYSEDGLYELTLGLPYPERRFHAFPICPALSPDGSMLSYLDPVADTGVCELMVIDLATSNTWGVAELTPVGLGCPVWQP